MVYFTSESAKQFYQIIAPMQGYLLTLHNYEEWRFHMTSSLISQGLWHVVRGQNWSDITLEKDDIVFRSIMYTIDDSLYSKILPSSFLSAKELWDYLRLQFAQSHDLAYDHVQQAFKAKSVHKCEVLPIFTFPVIDLHDEFFLSFGDLWEDVAALPNPERAIKECTDCCFDLEMVNLQQEGTSQSIFFDLDLQHEMLDNTCLLENTEIIDQFHGEEQCAGNTQGVMEIKEFVYELPWMDLYEQNAVFNSIITKDRASLAECLGYVACTDIQGISHILKSDISNDPKDNYEFSGHKWQSHISSTAKLTYRDFYMVFYITQKFVIKDFYIDKKREWYRGRNIWFEIKFQWHSWLLLWLNLLHMLNSSTGVLSLQQCLSSGGMILRVLVIRGDVRILYSI